MNSTRRVEPSFPQQAKSTFRASGCDKVKKRAAFSKRATVDYHSLVVVVKLIDLDPQGRWFDPWCGHDEICTAVGALEQGP